MNRRKRLLQLTRRYGTAKHAYEAYGSVIRLYPQEDGFWMAYVIYPDGRSQAVFGKTKGTVHVKAVDYAREHAHPPKFRKSQWEMP